MAYQLFHLPKSTNIGTASFRLESGAKAYFFATGTSTPQNTYQDDDLTTPHAHPVVADSAGVLPAIYLNPTLQYSLTLNTSAGALIYSVDPVNDQVLSAASVGLALYPKTQTETAAGVTPTNYAYPPGNVLRYGADRTGVAASDTAFASAVSAVCPVAPTNSLAGEVIAPAGTYLLNTSLNLTNTRVNGTQIRDGLILRGEGMVATVIKGGCGSGRATIETTGAQWLQLKDFMLTDAASTPSTVSIFQGVSSTLTQTQNQSFRNILILMADNAGVNGGPGAVGLWNYGAEENTYDTVWVQANVPAIFTAQNPPVNFTATTPTSYQALSASHSLGVTTFSGECFLVSANKRGPSLITENVNSIHFDNVYMANSGTGGANQSAWNVYGALQGANFNGTVESHARVMDITGAVVGAYIRATFGGLDSPSTERIRLIRGGQGTITDSVFNLQDNVSPNRPLFLASPSATNELISCFIQNSTFKVNCDKQYVYIPENALWNPNTGNVTIEALHATTQPFRWVIDANRAQIVDIPATTCLINAGITNAEIVRFILPTVVSTANSLAADVEISGIAYIIGSGTGSMSCKRILAHVSIALSETGTPTTSTDAFLTGTTANVNAAGNNITALAISATNGTGHVKIIATPTRVGANNESVSFVGTATMRWAGNESRAPSLTTLT